MVLEWRIEVEVGGKKVSISLVGWFCVYVCGREVS